MTGGGPGASRLGQHAETQSTAVLCSHGALKCTCRLASGAWVFNSG